LDFSTIEEEEEQQQEQDEEEEEEETWSATLKEEHKLTGSANRVLKKIFRPKKEEVTGDWRRLHNAELLNLYSSPGVIRVIKSRRLRLAGHLALMGKG